MLIKDIVQDEGALCTDGRIFCISINTGSYHGKMVQVVGGDFFPCVCVGDVSLGTTYFREGSWRILIL